ncbi:uncharacterized protein LOC101947688 isoform X1 [Chrysemys picta bellii]|uniref:uncharacterized protein LOC101947688 isoform X1 n=1 Tax=Chrysemys picta bellii TaxID=8478 RepID=UPI0032B2EB2C
MIGNLACTLGRQTAAVAPRIIQMRRFLHGTHFRISSSVEEALADGRPIIALESTIITHGMPYPQNLSMAREVEEIVRTNGSVPATVGILNGRIHIGLNDEELQFLAKSKNLVKVSRRDLPYVLSQGLSGGTTVSGTMIVAHKAGIPVFVTGGIGGVHREGEKTMDVSADLTELGRTAVAVVSAGVKSILDIGRTLEYLETQGVCVAAFGDSREFPAFFSRQSGFQAPCQVQNEEEAAKLIASTLALGLGSGVLIAVPCPKEEAASGQVIEAAIQEALSNARSKGITGKELTPFMLQKVNELTSGKSLDSNIALIQNNARVGSRIAVALSKIQTSTGKGNLPRREKVTALRPVVIGGINVDFIAKARNTTIQMLISGMFPGDVFPAWTLSSSREGTTKGSTSKTFPASSPRHLKVSSFPIGPSGQVPTRLIELINPLQAGGQTNAGQVSQSFGGVGRNLADCLSRLGKTPLFISALGKDEHSESILRYCRHMDMAGVLQLAGHSTATYCAVITGSGELSLGLGDMDIHQQITEQYVSKFKESLCLAPLVCIDGNVPVATIQYVCEIAREHQIAVCYEPTDENKASKPFLSDSWKALTYISPNLRELRAINRTLGHPVLADLPSRLEDVVRTAMTLTHPLLTQLHCVVVTLGMHGVLLCGRRVEGSVSLCPGTRKQNPAGELCATHYPAIPISREEIVNVSGAGDSLMAGIIAGLLAGHDTDTCVRMGLLAACLSLRSYEPISREISTVSVNLEQVKARSWPEYSCPGIQSKTCQKPSDCDGCLGLYTCKLPRGKCGLKAVSRKTGGFYQSVQST